MGGKGSAPAAPDYLGAATAQAQASEKATTAQNFANRPSIYTPFGNQTWTTGQSTDPSTGQPVTTWQQNTTLAPGLQSALDAQVGLQNDRSQLASGFMGRVADEYAQPFDYSNLPAMASANAPSNLQSSIADYTPGLGTDVNSRSDQVTGAFDFANPVASVNAGTNGLSSGVQNPSLNANFSNMNGGIQSSVANSPVNTSFANMAGDVNRSTGTEALQRNLNTSDNPALPQYDSNYRNQVADALMARMDPIHQRQQEQLQTQLANQGFRLGSEGYKRALDELNMRQAAERYNALDTAGSEAQRLYNMQMGARQQAFNEDVTGGQFSNSAANQAFNQGLSANQFANQATQQAFNQAMQAQQAGNAAAGQQFNQSLAAGQFGNSAIQQAYAQALGAQQASNATLGQQFQQGVTNANLNNAAINQAYQQNLGAANFANQAQQQLYNQMMGQANLGNQAAQQQFNQDLASRQFANQALGQASALDIARMNAMNNSQAQQYSLNQQYANAQNALRQQAIAEQAQRRGMSLNEMNALLSGQQVSMPTMPTFNTAGRAETPQILQATQMGYDAALGNYNAQQAANSNTMGGLFSLGSAALANPYSAAFMFSDRRLKSNIKRVGTHPIGVGIYDYTMMGMPQRGVIAQEVQKVRPDLVTRHANSYLMVNYGGL